MAVVMILGQVGLSILAIFGLLFLFRAVFGGFFAPPSVTAAVWVRSKKDAEDLDILLSEAERSVFRRRGVPTVVLISPGLLQGDIGEKGMLFPVYREVICTYHAIIFIGSEEKQPSSE